MKYKLKEIAIYSNKKIGVNKINQDTYISTENMLPNKSGVVKAIKLPNQSKTNFFENKNILISNIRPYFKKIWYANFNGGCSNDVLNIKIKDETKVLSKYLYYNLLQDSFFEYIMSGSKGTKMPRGDKEHIMEYIIDIPNIDKQTKIVNILDKLNLKIELNNQINNNLYELSYEVFKNFKEEIKKRPIKEFCDFKELGSIIMGQSPKGESYNFDNIGIPLINGAADYQNGYLKPQKYTSMPTKVCKKGDLIFCIRATIGLLVVSNEEYCLGRGVAGIINTYDYYKEYVYHLINNSINEFKKMATGSVIVGISRDNIGNMKVSVPSEEQIIKFHTVQKPLFDKIENIREENKTLVQLRDTLLPKLMSGEVDLENIEI